MKETPPMEETPPMKHCPHCGEPLPDEVLQGAELSAWWVLGLIFLLLALVLWMGR